MHATRSWAVLLEREMRSGIMMILKIARLHATLVTLVEDDKLARVLVLRDGILTHRITSC